MSEEKNLGDDLKIKQITLLRKQKNLQKSSLKKQKVQQKNLKKVGIKLLIVETTKN